MPEREPIAPVDRLERRCRRLTFAAGGLALAIVGVWWVGRLPDRQPRTSGLLEAASEYRKKIHDQILERSPPPPTDAAMPYQIVCSSDISSATRKRLGITIYAPDAVTVEQRAETALRACVDAVSIHHVDFVACALMPSDDPVFVGSWQWIGFANYAPDGHGLTGPDSNSDRIVPRPWEALASTRKYDNLDVMLAAFWLHHEKLGTFNVPRTIKLPNGETLVLEAWQNEDRLIAYLAETFKIPQEEADFRSWRMMGLASEFWVEYPWNGEGEFEHTREEHGGLSREVDRDELTDEQLEIMASWLKSGRDR